MERDIMSNGRIEVIREPTVLDQIAALLAQIERLPLHLGLSSSEEKRLARPRAGAQEVIQAIIVLQRTAGRIP
jgi:hypothetical protein